MSIHSSLAAVAMAAAAVVATAPAHAALTFSGVACDGQGTSMTSQPGYLACSGAWDGNNSNQAADVASQISSDWGLTGLVESGVAGAPSTSSGTLSFANQMGTFVLALKAGRAFSLYEFDGSLVTGGISSIAFDTLGVGFYDRAGGVHFGQGLSHADIYAPVPEPEAYALMLVGLAGVGFMARRRKSA